MITPTLVIALIAGFGAGCSITNVFVIQQLGAVFRKSINDLYKRNTELYKAKVNIEQDLRYRALDTRRHDMQLEVLHKQVEQLQGELESMRRVGNVTALAQEEEQVLHANP